MGGALVLIVTLGWIGCLFMSYDAQRGTVTIPLIGKTLSLGGGEERREGRHERDDD